MKRCGWRILFQVSILKNYKECRGCVKCDTAHDFIYLGAIIKLIKVEECKLLVVEQNMEEQHVAHVQSHKLMQV